MVHIKIFLKIRSTICIWEICTKQWLLRFLTISNLPWIMGYTLGSGEVVVHLSLRGSGEAQRWRGWISCKDPSVYILIEWRGWRRRKKNHKHLCSSTPLKTCKAQPERSFCAKYCDRCLRREAFKCALQPGAGTHPSLVESLISQLLSDA